MILFGGLSAGQAPCGARHFPPDTPQVFYWVYISEFIEFYIAV